MQAIVSLLDKTHEVFIQNVWKDLKNNFGLNSTFANPIPHFSYLVNDEPFNQKLIHPVLESITSEKAHFEIQARGIRIFRKPKKVIFIPVVGNSKLTNLHSELCQEISKTGLQISNMYIPENWIPHITLLVGDSYPDNLDQIISHLSRQDFYLTININNLAIIDTGLVNNEASIFSFKKN